MKLSVKWLAGLAVLVLAVVAVVGSTSATKAAAGSIFVANEWSDITNESPAPTGYTSAGTVYSTYSDTGRIIQTDSDIVKVVVVDGALNPSVPTTVTNTANITVTSGGAGDDITAGIGISAVIELTGRSGSPIAGTLAGVQANTVISVDGGATNLVGTELAITNFYSGGGSNDPWIQVVVNVAGPYTINHIGYQTSTAGTANVVVKSDLDQTGDVSFNATETGIGTGRFQGWVKIVESGVTTAGIGSADGSSMANAIHIRAGAGQVTFSFADNESNNRETTVTLDTTAPTASITGPVDGSATQNQTPTFSGSISESGSGLKVNTIDVRYDDSNDPNNTTDVVNTSTAVNSGGSASLAVSTTGAVDGDTAFSFSKAPGSAIPSGVINPDNVVDWVIKASDLAGNVGLSDADPSASGVQLPTVKIDKVLPAFTTTAGDHKTGLANSASGEVSARDSLRVVFNDDVTNVQASDFTVTLDSTAVIAPISVTVVNDTTGISGLSASAKSAVYLKFANNIVSNDTPKVSLQDTISDLAGNFASQGDREVADGIAPSLTVTLSDGSGTGSGSEDSASLTNDEIQVTIESDEPLAGSPAVAVFVDGAGSAELNPTALASGSNRWIASYAKPGSPADGKRAVQVTATDIASNAGTVGGNDADASGTPNFLLDQQLDTPALSVGGGSATTDQTRPSIVIDFKAGGEDSTVTLNKVQLDGTDITADVIAASDGKRFFYIPPTDLSQGGHDLLVEAGDAVDAAGNENASDITLTVTVVERATFNLDMFVGWNAISFPSDPIDPDLNSVFDNAGHDAVLGFDPSVPGGWRVAVRDTVSGQLEAASESGLTSVRSTQAYWVHSNNFEQVSALLTGEVLPAAGSPPGIVTIPTVPGFNAVPIVDTDRKQTTGGSAALVRETSGSPVAVTVSSYLGAVNEGRVYTWNPETLSFELETGSSSVNTGEVLFVEIIPVDGVTSPIFP